MHNIVPCDNEANMTEGEHRYYKCEKRKILENILHFLIFQKQFDDSVVFLATWSWPVQHASTRRSDDLHFLIPGRPQKTTLFLPKEGFLEHFGIFLLPVMLTTMCSAIRAFNDIVAHAMWLPLVCSQKNRGVHVDFCAPRLRSVTQAVRRCDVLERVCGSALK